MEEYLILVLGVLGSAVLAGVITLSLSKAKMRLQMRDVPFLFMSLPVLATLMLWVKVIITKTPFDVSSVYHLFLVACTGVSVYFILSILAHIEHRMHEKRPQQKRGVRQ